MGGYTGGTSDSDLLRLRRMVAEPTETTYTDEMLVEIIQRYPVPDLYGVGSPWGADEAGWDALYDHALAAAEVWSEKSAAVALNFDFEADGATFSKVQQTQNYERQARRWRALRVPGSYTVESATPPFDDTQLIGNLNDPYA